MYPTRHVNRYPCSRCTSSGLLLLVVSGRARGRGLRRALIAAVGVCRAPAHHLQEVGPAGDGEAVLGPEIIHRVGGRAHPGHLGDRVHPPHAHHLVQPPEHLHLHACGR